ncbi:MAG: hypothetical protein LBJ67_06520 [Planctomycetaceae bacterium]|nr:hypothetical protein [Planctomycetaceae bacterium]
MLDLVVYLNNANGKETTLEAGTELGKAELELESNLPKGESIEITFELDEQGSLTLTG